MTLPSRLTVESHLLEYLPAQNRVRAKFLVTPIPTGEWIDVVVRARVYNLAEVQRRGMVPDTPLAEGGEVPDTARPSEWRVVDLPLPEMPYGKHAVVAKVYSRDRRYEAPFEPSLCYVGSVVYGLRPARMRFADLMAVYEGSTKNPLAEGYIRDQVRAGLIEVEDDDGQVSSVREEHGKLVLVPRT